MPVDIIEGLDVGGHTATPVQVDPRDDVLITGNPRQEAKLDALLTRLIFETIELRRVVCAASGQMFIDPQNIFPRES